MIQLMNILERLGWRKFDWNNLYMIYILIFILLLGICSFFLWHKKKHLNKKHLYWNHISGFGELECLDCGKKMWIYAFLHGVEYMIIGTQCQKCGTYFGTRIKFSNFKNENEKDKDLVCTKCGHLCIKHDRIFKENTEPLFCPNCKSHNLKYTMDFIT